jgi:hypothetical protein
MCRPPGSQVPSTWNPGKSSTANSAVERTRTFCRLRLASLTSWKRIPLATAAYCWLIPEKMAATEAA